MGKPFGLHELEYAGPEKLLVAAQNSFQADHGRPGFAHYTFMDRGFEKKIATLVITDQPPEQIEVSATRASMAQAIGWVRQHNPHLHFKNKLSPLTSQLDEGEEVQVIRLELA